MRLADLSFRTKAILPGLVSLLGIAVAIPAMVLLSSRANDELDQVRTRSSPALELARDLELALDRIQGQLRDAATAEDITALELADEQMDKAVTRAAEWAAFDAAHGRELQDALRGYYAQARDATFKMIKANRFTVEPALLQALTARYNALKQDLAGDTARARIEVARGFEQARSWQRRAVWAGAAVLVSAALLSALFALAMAASISRPLEALQRAALRIADGDLTVTVERHGADEIGAVADSFRRMADRTRGILATLRDASAELARSADDLADTMKRQTALLETQAGGVSRTTTTTRELEQSSQVAANRAGAVLEVARRAAEASESGRTSATKSLEGIQQIQGAVQSIIGQSTGLLGQARQVGEIVETVKDLATQSHVLSLNASIEAARAGEAGKGFAVVASEVRALAEQSGAAAARIGKMVQEILGAIQSTLDLTERSRRGMDGSVNAIRASGESLAEIGAIVKETSEAAMQIASAVQQQSTGMAQIAGAMRDVDTGMEETLGRVQALGAAAERLRATSGRIAELVAGFRV